MKFIQSSLVLAASIFSSSCLAQETTSSIVDIAVNDGRFTTLVSALTSADLVTALSGEGPFTVFAPVDDAFGAVPPKFLEPMYSEHLKNILLYHVISGAEVFSTDLMLDMEAETMNGESLTVTSLTPVQINGVDVIIPDLDATNGVVHVVDEVLLPNAATKSIVDLAVETPELSTLVDLLTAADLVETLSGDGPFTVFAPVNSAFDALPPADVEALLDPANKDALTDILLYHVVTDDIILSTGLAESDAVAISRAAGSMESKLMLDPNTVVIADILANNGVVHVIDTVLMPPEDDHDHDGMDHDHDHDDEDKMDTMMEDEDSSANNVLKMGGMMVAAALSSALFMAL